jgi:Zn-dependent protease with chaperone function
MQRRFFSLLLAAFLPVLTSVAPAAQKGRQKEVKVQKTSMTREQEIELGKQAAAQIERELEVMNNREIEAWLNSIGQRLAKTPQANAYPYYFKLVNEDSINAFALPGGPMYVHTGLIKAADNEGQVAGVLGHEMSHVALRHSASQIGRTNTLSTILGIAGAAAGMAGGTAGTILGTAVQTGGGLGVASMLSKFSRDAERDADLNGARMVAEVGYNPIEVARFFEKLEAEMGDAGRPRGLDAWLSSHPNPGKRVQYVSEDIQYYPQKSYTAETGQFERIRKLVGSLPPPKMKPAAAMQPIQAQPRSGLPQGYADLQLKDFAVAYPGSWKPGQSQGGGGIYIVPQGGAKRTQQGGVELILGALVDYNRPPGDANDLRAATNALLNAFQQADKDMRIDRTEQTTVGRKPALVTRLRTRSSYPQDPNQDVLLYTVVREAGLWTLALAAPTSRFGEADPIFRQMIQTVKFAD